jgi:hypothetical protein
MTKEEEDQKRDLIRAYRVIFLSPSGQTVIKDLMKSCRFRNSLVPLDLPQDTNAVMQAEGRRQVMLHILQMTAVSEEDLLTLYRGGTIVETANA